MKLQFYSIPLWKLTERDISQQAPLAHTNLPKGGSKSRINTAICHFDMEIKLNEIHFQILQIYIYIFSHFTDSGSDSDQWSESERQLHFYETLLPIDVWAALVHHKSKQCCLSACPWWRVPYNCKPLHGSSPHLPSFYWTVPVSFFLSLSV